MNFRTGAVAVLAVLVVFLALTTRLPGTKGSAMTLMGYAMAEPRSPDAGSTPVLVELFTSEGCSSCPPADALLAQLGRTQPVRNADTIVLEEHVDYWDSLGWKDPYSSAIVTSRQSDYGQAFGGEQVYTPQMVVDGNKEFVGNSQGEALRAIRAAAETPKPAVQLSWADGGMLAIQVGRLANASHSDTPQVYLAVTQDKLHSDVKRGENAGHALEHDGVVRQFTVVGKADPGPTGFSSTIPVHAAPEWIRANLRAVVFVQERRSRHVLAVSSIPFPAA
jgi:hypothetical protein